MASDYKPVTEYLIAEGVHPYLCKPQSTQGLRAKLSDPEQPKQCRIARQLKLFPRRIHAIRNSPDLGIDISAQTVGSNPRFLQITVRSRGRVILRLLVYLRSREDGEKAMPLFRADYRIAYSIVHQLNFTPHHTLRRIYDIPKIDLDRIVSDFWASRYGQKIRRAEEERMEMLRSAWFPLKKEVSPAPKARRAAV